MSQSSRSKSLLGSKLYEMTAHSLPKPYQSFSQGGSAWAAIDLLWPPMLSGSRGFAEYSQLRKFRLKPVAYVLICSLLLLTATQPINTKFQAKLIAGFLLASFRCIDDDPIVK